MDSGPCHTCQHAAGILATSTGLYRICSPDQWGDCEALRRSRGSVKDKSSARRRRGLRIRALLWKTRAVGHFLRS
jgi:hypothetical protein